MNNIIHVGASVLMTPLFTNGNFNRSGKKIRVTVEEPAGQYQLFSRDEDGSNMLYLLTKSGMLSHTAYYFRDDWDESAHKHVNHRPTEVELQALLPQIAAQFKCNMADPAQWARYQDAAVVDQLDACDAHNAILRKLRDEKAAAQQVAAEQEQAEKQRKQQEKFEARIDEIANAIERGETISVSFNQYAYSQNPMLTLFKMYGIDLPLRTQGWVNTGLAVITPGSYRFFKRKHKGDSTVFGGYLIQLRKAVTLMPIAEKRRIMAQKEGEAA